MLGEYQLTWWSQFNELDITFPQDLSGALDRHLFERYQNTSGFRFGAEWAKDAKWMLRGGYLHTDGGAPAETATPLMPESHTNLSTAVTTAQCTTPVTK